MAEIDVVKEAELLIMECEMRAREWKAKADGARMLFHALTAKAREDQMKSASKEEVNGQGTEDSKLTGTKTETK